MHGKKPTRSQYEYLKRAHINPDNWLIAKDTPTIMLLVCRHNRQTKLIKKEWYNK